jgi:hypothetical protein
MTPNRTPPLGAKAGAGAKAAALLLARRRCGRVDAATAAFVLLRASSVQLGCGVAASVRAITSRQREWFLQAVEGGSQRGGALMPAEDPCDRDQAIAVLRETIELGVTHIDISARRRLDRRQ